MRGFRGLWVTFFTLFFALGAAADVDGEEVLRKHSHSGKDSRKNIRKNGGHSALRRQLAPHIDADSISGNKGAGHGIPFAATDHKIKPLPPSFLPPSPSWFYYPTHQRAILSTPASPLFVHRIFSIHLSLLGAVPPTIKRATPAPSSIPTSTPTEVLRLPHSRAERRADRISIASSFSEPQRPAHRNSYRRTVCKPRAGADCSSDRSAFQ